MEEPLRMIVMPSSTSWQRMVEATIFPLDDAGRLLLVTSTGESADLTEGGMPPVRIRVLLLKRR
jgi:hypothetical protein